MSKCRLGTAPAFFQYVYNVGVMLSQNLSVLLGGDPDETVCSRTGKASRLNKKWFVKYQEPFLNWLMNEENHCQKVIEIDEGSKTVWRWDK